MATKVYLHGHGSWKPSMGHILMPKGCSIVFYTHFAKLLNQTMVKQILEGAYAGDTDRTIGEFKAAPNLQMSSLTHDQMKWANQTFAGTGAVLHMLPAGPPMKRKSLEALIDECVQAFGKEIEFHWLCCQSLALTQMGGRAVGLNASDRTAQEGREGYYLFKWKEGGQEKTKWVKSNSSIHQ
jgi:hypothetical protein